MELEEDEYIDGNRATSIVDFTVYVISMDD